MSCFACFPMRRWASCRETSPVPQELMLQGERHVGDYKEIQTVGRGKFGTVSLAEHSRTKSIVALKALLLSEVPEDDIRKEVLIHRRLCHPNIISLHDVTESSSRICIVMEYATGGALVEYVHQNHYCADNEGRRMFKQLIAGVEYCHSLGVAHRDIKLDNILLDKEQNVKLADFGLAEEMVNGEVFALPKGSTPYAPAELFLNGVCRYMGAPVDVYSCGVVLFCLLCGNFPFVARSASSDDAELIRLIKLGRFDVPRHVSCTAEMLLRKLITTSVIQRLTIKELKEHRWMKDQLSSELNGESQCKPATLLERMANLNQSMSGRDIGVEIKEARDGFENFKISETGVTLKKVALLFC